MAKHIREDLFYRLNVVAIELPPLRQRPRGHSPVGRAHPRQVVPSVRLASPRLIAGSADVSDGPAVAGQRPSIAKCAGASGHPRARSGHRSGRRAGAGFLFRFDGVRLSVRCCCATSWRRRNVAPFNKRSNRRNGTARGRLVCWASVADSSSTKSGSTVYTSERYRFRLATLHGSVATAPRFREASLTEPRTSEPWRTTQRPSCPAASHSARRCSRISSSRSLVTGILTLQEAVSPQSNEYETLILLLGMMIAVGCLRLSGFFRLLAHGCLVRVSMRFAQRIPGRFGNAYLGLDAAAAGLPTRAVENTSQQPQRLHFFFQCGKPIFQHLKHKQAAFVESSSRSRSSPPLSRLSLKERTTPAPSLFP